MSYFAGRISHNLDFWETLTNDNHLLNHVRGIKIPFVSLPSQSKVPNPIHCSINEKIAMDNEICNYVKSGIVEEVSHCEGEFVSQIFPRIKKSGGVRIILNLNKLNELIQYEHFKMETLNSALLLMENNCFMGSIDLKDAYYSVNIRDEDGKYLRFEWNNKLFEFTCLPNGLACAPRLFTKIMKPIFMKLRKLGHISVYYLDDTWLCGNSREECIENIKITRETLSKAGFLINEEKSIFEPAKQISFLGFILNSTDMTVSLPEDKILNILNLCEKILKLETFRIRFLAEFIGVLVSCLPGVEFGELYYRFLEKNKNNSLKLSKGDFDGSTRLDDLARAEILWWQNNVRNSKKLIHHPPPTFILTTDASLAGWGAVFEDASCGGQWKPDEKEFHINVLELKAIEFGLKSFFNQKENVHIRIKSDNITAVTYVNNKGGTKSIPCHQITKLIWEWAIRRNNFLSAEHLPGSQNTLADKASRIFDQNTEWELEDWVFYKIIDHFGKAKIDLFASRLNNKLPIYVSWKPDPNAMYIDAFSFCWTDLNFYAFPPFSVILRTITKVYSDAATGILICPMWPTQAWFPKLMKMLIAPPLILPRDSLFLPFTPDVRHKQKDLCLMACLLSGKASKTEDFQKTLPISCAPLGDQIHLNSTLSILKNGLISVMKGKSIPIHIMK